MNMTVPRSFILTYWHFIIFWTNNFK